MPKSKFSSTMKNRIQCEKTIRQNFPVDELWQWQASQVLRPLFVLHDGPPFANGPLHTGHFLNKIQKDIIVRYKLLHGYRLDFRPGWDCHGLPIELKALQEKNANSNDNDPMTVRKLARQFASQAIDIQKREFESWSILADWKNCYRTFDKEFIIDELRLFWKLYQKNLLYRQYKPVNWSPSVQSALAESELEYNDKHKSTAVYVRFRLRPDHALAKLFPQNEGENNIYAIIWTTTPWSLIANQAVAVNEKLKYIFVKMISTGDIYIVAESLMENMKKFEPFSSHHFETIGDCLGSQLSGLSYHHPIYRDDHAYPIVTSDHVTDDLGTGLVHIAPAHGADDFLLSIKYNLSCINAVDLTGHLHCPSIDSLHGRNALDKTDGIRAILTHLNGNLLHEYELTHSYPYDWRTKQPVLILGSQQWFIDTTRLRDDARRYLTDNVQIFPEGAGKSFLSMTAQRPYWCISRQRFWGVPIPVFYSKDDEQCVINEEIIEHLIERIQTSGSIDFWWSSKDIKDLLPSSLHNQAENLVRSTDIFDVWWDSGSSFHSILKNHHCQADLYCEGHDQFNGWFLSSLLLSTAVQSQTPFATLFVHGFVVDKNNQKMSKSIGNVIQPSDLILGGDQQSGQRFAENGLDVCREWVTRESYKIQCRASVDELNKAYKRVFDIRNVLKFLLGNLYDYQPDRHRIVNEELTAIDRYMAFRLHTILSQYHTDFDQYRMYHGLLAVEDFILGDVSSLYCTVTKDRLYCNPANSYLRRSTQTVFHLMLKCLNERLAPVMPYLAQELYNELTVIEKKQTSDVFRHGFTELDLPLKSLSSDLSFAMTIVLHLRNTFHSILQSRRAILSDITLYLSEKAQTQFEQVKTILHQHPSTVSVDFWHPFEELLQCSKIHLRSLSELENQLSEENISSVDLLHLDDKFNYVMKIQSTHRYACPRCRLQISEHENELCHRCSNFLSSHRK